MLTEKRPSRNPELMTWAERRTRLSTGTVKFHPELMIHQLRMKLLFAIQSAVEAPIFKNR
jgi:hypothetical protein